MPKENQEIKKQTIDVVIAPAKNIKYRNEFNNEISSQIIPVGIVRAEHTAKAVVII